MHFPSVPRPRRTLVILMVTILTMGATLSTPAGVSHASRPGSAVNSTTNVTLSVYTCCGSPQGFNDTNPTHFLSIHNVYGRLWAKLFPGLKWNETAINTLDQLETKLSLAVNSGNPPDLVFLQSGLIGFTVLRKLAQPLDQFYKKYGISDSHFLPAMAKWAHFGGHWWAIPAVSGPYGGQYVYLPKYMSALGYNSSNLRTWNEYYQMSRKAVQFDKSGNLTRIGYWPGAQWYSPNSSVSTLMCPVGHGLYNAADQPTATDPCNVAWLTYLKKLVDLYGGYAKLNKFLAGDPSDWSGSPKAYLVTGKILIDADCQGIWSITPYDTYNFGLKSGLQYQVLPPPTVHGTLAEAANYPTTQVEMVIPPGAKHPDAAFAVSKMMFWDYGYLLGPTTNGDPVAKDQERWVQAMVAGEAAQRKRVGLPGNPAATLQGLMMQPQLARLSTAVDPINPVDPYYEEQLNKYTAQVLYGQGLTPLAALQIVQRLVVADEQRLEAQYGSWNW